MLRLVAGILCPPIDGRTLTARGSLAVSIALMLSGSAYEIELRVLLLPQGIERIAEATVAGKAVPAKTEQIEKSFYATLPVAMSGRTAALPRYVRVSPRAHHAPMRRARLVILQAKADWGQTK